MRGFSLIEMIVAIAVFSVVVVGLATFGSGSTLAPQRAAERNDIDALFSSTAEALRAIRHRAWNEFIYTTTTIAVSSSEWVFAGEGQSDVVNGIRRELVFSPVCRNAAAQVVDCSEGDVDLHSTRIRIRLHIPEEQGAETLAERTLLLTNWDSAEWEQTDWSGGSGQALFSEDTRYGSDNGNMRVDVAGLSQLRDLGACRVKHWTFDDPAQYAFDPEKIRVENGKASLIASGTAVTGFERAPLSRSEFVTSTLREPRILHVAGQVYAIAFRGEGNDGYIRTVRVAETGVIAPGYIDEFEFDPNHGQQPDFLALGGELFAVAYQGPGADGFVKTIRIDDEGTIQGTIDTLEFDTSQGQMVDLLALAGEIYALTYRGPGSDGFVSTIRIDENGQIGKTPGLFGKGVIDRIEFDTALATDPEIIHVSANIYAVVYLGPGNDGTIRTMVIDDEGVIDDTPHGGGVPAGVIDTRIFDAANGADPYPLHIAGNVFAIAYRGAGNDGWLVTVPIKETGIIGDILDRLEYNPSNGFTPTITHASDDVYLISHRGNGSDGHIALVRIQDAGDIADAVVHTVEYSSNDNTIRPHMYRLSDTHVVVAAEGPDADGFIYTAAIKREGAYPNDSPSIAATAPLDVLDIGQWSVFDEQTSTSPDSRVTFQLSTTAGEDWQWWNGNAWVEAVGANESNTATDIRAHLHTFSTSTGSLLVRAFLHSNGAHAVALHELVVGCTNFQYEVGQAKTDESWVRVPLRQRYVAPVIVAHLYESPDMAPASARVRGITSSSFELSVQPVSMQDDLPAVPLTYMVVEQGVWKLGGALLEANRHNTATVGNSTAWKSDLVSFAAPFASDPIVLHQVQTAHDPAWITSYVSGPNSRSSLPTIQGMRIALSGAEATSTHGMETIGWIAIEHGATTSANGVDMEVRRLGISARGIGTCSNSALLGAYDAPPLVIGAQQHMRIVDGSWAHLCRNTSLRVGFQAQEAPGNPPEEQHNGESVGYIAFREPTAFSAVPNGGVGLATFGELYSSAFRMGTARALQLIEWAAELPACDPACAVRIQVQAAPNNGGIPGAWTPWYGPAGPGTFFTTPGSALIPAALNGFEWIRYRVQLIGDGNASPVLSEIRLNYQ